MPLLAWRWYCSCSACRLWFFNLHRRKTGEYFKENIQVQAFWNRTAGKKISTAWELPWVATPYIPRMRVEYNSKEMAIKNGN